VFRQEAIDNHNLRSRGRALLLPGTPFWLTAGLCLFFLIAFLTLAIAAGAPIYQIHLSKSTRSGVVIDNQQRDIDDQRARIAQIISRLESSKQATLTMLKNRRRNIPPRSSVPPTSSGVPRKGYVL